MAEPGGPCTFGRRTEIPGMKKFSECAKLQVWRESVRAEMNAWASGMKRNPPNTQFRILQPSRSECPA